MLVGVAAAATAAVVHPEGHSKAEALFLVGFGRSAEKVKYSFFCGGVKSLGTFL